MKIINLNSRSVTIELESNTPYYNEEEYEIFLNDNLIRKEKRNVFTIYDLEPDSDYKIEAQGIINFHICYDNQALIDYALQNHEE